MVEHEVRGSDREIAEGLAGNHEHDEVLLPIHQQECSTRLDEHGLCRRCGSDSITRARS